MTDETTNDHWVTPATDLEPSDAGPSDAGPPGQPTTPTVEPAPVALASPTLPAPVEPKPGHLTLPWRVATFALWIAVILALASVWNASVQLGLSTWWLGPRGEPQPRLVQLSPFLAPIVMLLGTINHLRWLGRFGIGAAVVLAVFAIPDLGDFTSIATLELLIALAAGLVSAASLTGTYRPAT